MALDLGIGDLEVGGVRIFAKAERVVENDPRATERAGQHLRLSGRRIGTVPVSEDHSSAFHAGD